MKKKIYHSWIHAGLRPMRTKRAGMGLFTRRRFKKGDILVIFGGYVFTRQEELRFPPDMNDFAHHILPDFVIGIRKRSQLQPVDYINHSCDPNVGFKGQIILMAMRDIRKGEEITFDYCMVLSRPRGVRQEYRFTCGCGATSCRGIVTWNDWKKPALQRKYRGYFQWYLEEMIQKAGRKKVKR